MISNVMEIVKCSCFICETFPKFELKWNHQSLNLPSELGIISQANLQLPIDNFQNNFRMSKTRSSLKPGRTCVPAGVRFGSRSSSGDVHSCPARYYHYLGNLLFYKIVSDRIESFTQAPLKIWPFGDPAMCLVQTFTTSCIPDANSVVNHRIPSTNWRLFHSCTPSGYRTLLAKIP